MPNKCVLPFLEDGIQYEKCSATRYSKGYAWCPVENDWMYGGQEGFAGKDLGYGWDFCGDRGSGLEPYDCTYGKE